MFAKFQQLGANIGITFNLGLDRIGSNDFSNSYYIYGPDSYELLMMRVLRSRYHSYRFKLFALIKLLFFRYKRYKLKKSTFFIVVGKVDRIYINTFARISNQKAYSIAHPVRPATFSRYATNNPIAKIGISGTRGKLQQFYTGSFVSDLINDVNAVKYFKEFEFIILGKDNYDLHQFFTKNNIKSSFCAHIENYDDFLGSIDAYLAFDIIGAGTKNRILQALSCNIPVIGTKYSYENISGVTSKHIYATHFELYKILEKIKSNQPERIITEKFFITHSESFFDHNVIRIVNDIKSKNEQC